MLNMCPLQSRILIHMYSQNTFERLILLFHVEVMSNKALLWLAFQQNPGFFLSLLFFLFVKIKAFVFIKLFS